MAEQVSMEIPAVKNLGKRFEQMGDVLKQTSNALQVAITVLKASAFVGMFSNMALAHYLESLKPQIDNYAARCVEMAADLIKSAEAFERGDAQGAARFH